MLVEGWTEMGTDPNSTSRKARMLGGRSLGCIASAWKMARSTRGDARWGDATVYQWIERGLALYARVQATTQLRRKGFDMEVEMDDVAEGKVGLRVQRSLE